MNIITADNQKRKPGRPKRPDTTNPRTPHNVYVMLTDDEYSYIVEKVSPDERRRILLTNYKP